MPLGLDATATTDEAGAILVPGPNQITFGGTDVMAVVWLVDQDENTMSGSTIDLTSIGAIELGQGPADVTAAAGVAVPVSGAPCNQIGLPGDPYSPVLTFRDGALVVVQVFTPGLPTLSGIAIGSTSAEITAAYGDRIETRPSADADPSRELMAFRPTDEDDQIYRLVFDLTADRVTSIRFGATEIVADQPGCGT